eukprot:GCRY01002103.1.p1 GENE.GCRY01002103.1~~GCRY01002103.1.p1  ORF type:complete len:295 (+),score=62.79 GCRY01002103.1:139-1023(+)
MGDVLHAVKINTEHPERVRPQNISKATELLEKRREMFEVQAALDAQKEEYEANEERIKRREEDLRKRDLELQESLVKFNKFLMENDAKRARAERKALEEMRTREVKEREIDNLKDLLNRSIQKKERFLLILEKYILYQRYLDRVLEVAEDYTEINALLERYATLADANKQLLSYSRDCQEESEETRKNLETFIAEKSNEILSYDNEVADLQTKLERARDRTSHMQSELDQHLAGISSTAKTLGEARMAIDNLCQQLGDRLVRKATFEDPEAQLRAIKEHITFLAGLAAGKFSGK